MKFSIDVATLRQAVTLARRTIPSAAGCRTLPALAGARLEVGPDGRIRMESTDLELHTRQHLKPFEVGDAEGAALVPLKALAAALKSHSGEVTVATLPDDKVAIGNTALAALDPEAWPTLPDCEGERFERFEAATLRDVVASVLPAASDRVEHRFRRLRRDNLCAIHVHSDACAVYFDATDGHRLHRARIGAHVWDGDTIVPRGFWVALLPHLKGKHAPGVSFTRDGRLLRATVGSIDLTARLIDGEYPNVAQVVPPRNVTLRADRKTLAQALASVRAATPERSGAVQLEPDPDGIRITASNPEGASASALCPADVVAEGWQPIAFNIRYVLDALEALVSDRVELHFRDPLSAALLAGTDDPRECIVMPMRL